MIKITSQGMLNLRTYMTRSARSVAPVDTGNLKRNGIYSMKRGKGFKLVWDLNLAYYIKAVNEEIYKTTSAKTSANKNFVDRGIALALKNIMDFTNGNKSALLSTLRKKPIDKNDGKKHNNDYVNMPQTLYSYYQRQAKAKKKKNIIDLTQDEEINIIRGRSRIIRKLNESIQVGKDSGQIFNVLTNKHTEVIQNEKL